MAAEAPAQAVAAAESADVFQVFDALANDGAVKPREFALMMQLEAKSLMRNMVMSQLQPLADVDEDANPLPIHTSTLKTILPLVKKSFDKFDAAHMRTMLEMLFRVMDGNQNGKIEKKEFEDFFGKIGELAAAPDPNAIGDFAFKLVDKNGNGKLSLEEAQTLIDSVVEILGTVLAGAADILETIICSPETAAAMRSEMLLQMKEDGVVVGEYSGECDETEKTLKVGPDWYHKKDAGSDLCKEAYDAYTGEDKALYFVVDTVEKIKADKFSWYYMTDPNAAMTREHLADELKENGFFDDVKEMFADGSQTGLKAQIVQMMKLGREALGKVESNVGAQFYMKAMEWSQGGVDEATFLCQVVPLMRESQAKEMEKMREHPMEEFKKQIGTICEANNIPQEMAGMCDGVIQTLVDSGEFIPALERGQVRSQEYNAEIARAFFRFLDLDNSGRITSNEIRLLKALLDALLHLGERATHDLSSGEVKPMEGTVEDNAKELAFAMFDVLDKDGNGKLSIDEMIAFAQKVLLLVLEMMKYNAHALLECVWDEIFKALASIGWKQAGIEEVGKEQLMQTLMMAPMMMAPMMMQMQMQMQGLQG